MALSKSQLSPNMLKLRYGFLLNLLFVLPASAASLPAGGYFSDFSSKPGVGDFSTRTVTGGAADIQSVAAVDTRVQALTAGSVNSVLADAATPVAATGTGLYSAADERILTKPTGVQLSVLMATFTNDTGSELDGITLTYDLDKTGSVGGEQIDGQRLYMSVTGVANEWTVLGTFASLGQVNLPITFSTALQTGGTFYLLWADDNGPGSPDDAFSVDNVSLTPKFASVPEPSGVVLSGLCLAGLAARRARRR